MIACVNALGVFEPRHALPCPEPGEEWARRCMFGTTVRTNAPSTREWEALAEAPLAPRIW